MGNSLNRNIPYPLPSENEHVSTRNTWVRSVCDRFQASILFNNSNTGFLESIQNDDDNVNLRDVEGNTPLQLAVMNERRTLFKFLLSLRNTQIDATNLQTGLSALSMAVLQDKMYYAVKLIEKGANINMVDKQGYTPLHYGVQFGSVELCRVLIEHGASLNAQNLSGKTPLHMACNYGNTEKICMLLYYGADPSIPCKEGIIPLLVNRVNSLETHLKVALYCYTFDGGEITMQMKTLVKAMLQNGPLFPKMIENVCKITYDETDLRYLNESLPDIAPGNFKMFLEKFDYSIRDMFWNCCTLSNYLTVIESMRRKTPEFVDLLHILIESHLVYEAVQSCCKSFPVVASLVKIFHKHHMPLKALTELVCCLLSYGLNVTPTDLNAVYVYHGYCELFNIMLHMDIEPTGDDLPCCSRYDYEVVQTSVMIHFIYNIDMNIDKFLERPQCLLSIDLDILLDYFALPKLKDFFSTDRFQGHKVCAKIAKLPTVPLLIELARNAARQFIIKRYEIQNCRQFYTVMKYLPVNDVYKQILTYEKKLYPL